MYKVLDMFKFKRNRKSKTMHKTIKSTVTARATKIEELYYCST